jgi:TolB-like protein
MSQKRCRIKNIALFFCVVLIVIAACSSEPSRPVTPIRPAVSVVPAATPSVELNDTILTADDYPNKGNDGKGIVIVVPLPNIQNISTTNSWIPQLFQDIITGDMARFSAMTVIDRKNESLILAEQQLVANGNYSDDNYISMGKLTNAQYIVAGTITPISGNYQVNFRINNTETNEIKTAFHKNFSFNEVESGIAANEVVIELLLGMGINLTDTDKRAIYASSATATITATRQLAQGMAAEKEGNYVEALSFYELAASVDGNYTEAASRSQQVLSVSTPTSVRERAQWGQDQAEKWNKIFRELEIYMRENILLAVVLDLGNSGYTDSNMNISSGHVDIQMNGQGIKFVPNRTALLVFEKIRKQWDEITKNSENQMWTDSVRGGYSRMTEIAFNFDARIELLDEDNARIYNTNFSGKNQRFEKFNPNNSSYPLLSQERYYVNSNFTPIKFNRLAINRITDELNIQIENVRWNNSDIKPLHIFSISEWQEWFSQNEIPEQPIKSANAAPANVAITKSEVSRLAVENLLREYGPNIFPSGKFQFGNSMSSRAIDNAMTSYAFVKSRGDIIALYNDAWLSKNEGKSGFVFTAEGVYSSWNGIGYIKYADFVRLEEEIVQKETGGFLGSLFSTGQEKEPDIYIKITMSNTSSVIRFNSYNLKPDQLRIFLEKARNAVR